MSILATTFPTSPPTPPTTLPAVHEVSPTAIVAMLGIMAAIVVAAMATGIFRPRKFGGPERVPPGRGAWAMVLVMAGGMFSSIAAQAIYLSYRMHRLQGPSSTQSASFDLSLLTGADFAIVSIIPVIAFALLLEGDRMISPALPTRLGVNAGRLKPALLHGLISLTFVLPLMYATTVLIEQLYELLRFEHPKEHELLKAMGDSKNFSVRIALVIGAVIVAPLFEELIFRGHLQSLLRSLFSKLGALRLRDETISDVLPPIREDFALSYESPAEPSRYEPSTAASWGAIVLSSMCFALVHERWTWPVIFLLALCLGYAYERTQNLWVPIIIHAGFNAASTIAFLMISG